ncbi:DUF2851 family protein [Desertivirga brevis]|uniref:DUF2851 family protein n=1 Tax=Desertivirga brevis TaxID=2810310 RepID=UPI001A96A4AF|nr:DUF2851 family protein [Pedobacter sp. SYSU D00873]
MAFNEDFLHFLWKYRLFSQRNLQLTTGQEIEILATGVHNKNSGADFENAKIRTGKTTWVGNVEIHLRSSDWDKHNHTGDKAYNNVILHVVYEDDKPVFRNDGSRILTLELRDLISPGLQTRYKDLMENLSWIPCEQLFSNVAEIHVENWLLRVSVERLEEKMESVLSILKENRGNWDDTFYILLARNFGFKTNALPFELLAKSLPQQILSKHKNSSFQIEALVFGQSGFLEHAEDTYSKMLKLEYHFLQKKFKLKPIDQHLWKFLRLRPQNFPTLRLAQFAALIVKSNHLFSKVLEVKETKEAVKLFRELPVNEYWRTHYRFGKKVEKVAFHLGDEAIYNIILNSVAITLFAYGRHIGNAQIADRAISLLESIPAETNHVVARFKKIGVLPMNALRSQGLLQLKKYYCDQKKCLNCAVGAKILKVT